MIDPAHPTASWFLLLVAPAVLVVFGFPLLFVPFEWARVFRWRLPEDRGLARYFGRCLGGVVTVTAIVAFRAAPHPADNRAVFEITVGVGALMTLIHVWGFLRREQP